MSSLVKRIVLIAAIIVAGGFLLIQLVPYGHNHINPPVVSDPQWDSPQTKELAQRACYDCHSNETVYPWYSNIAPVSWLVQRDAEEGRRFLNFSTWGSGGEGREPGEAIEAISEGEMPPPMYLTMHPDAPLTPSEKQALMEGLRATIYR